MLTDLLDYLKQHPVTGEPPKRTLVYGYTFDERADDAKYNEARDEFIRQFGLAVGSSISIAEDGVP